ncbi:MAG: hypothetical protein IPP34_20025 [Bacteroidetes bacterium]|nr:hypothetical protein [Bacteroidota bacterium]
MTTKQFNFLVDDQINFHSDRAICHCKYAEKLEHKAEMLNKAVLYLVIADLIIAILYWLSGFCDFNFQPLTLLHSLTGLLILLTISLPALVAAYTGLTAQSEYYKLSLRNIRLKRILLMQVPTLNHIIKMLSMKFLKNNWMKS